MRPEELSAEVIKSLRGDVQQRTGEEVMAAAISVPAAFELSQCEATNRAARLAGLSLCRLIREPVAAALAYGFQSQSNLVRWMVYNFGGGTFDVAIIQVRDGQVQVVNHSGDNQLGGKLIEWEIVEGLFVPALKKEYALTDFKRGNPKWTAAFAKLKLHAEQARIQVSRDKVTDILIDPLCQDDRGNWVKFEYELTRNDAVSLIEPFVERSVNLCQKTLEEKRLSPGDIEKIILIGEATLTPIFREILAAKLKIPLEFSIDPFTVIARGTAIFAGTQPMPKEIVRRQRPDPDVRYELLYENRGIGKYYNDPKKLASEFQNKKVYLENLRRRAQQLGAVQADELFRRIQEEGMIHDIEVSLAEAQDDPDAADKCEKRLRDLKTAIDEVEDAVEFFALVSKAEKEIEDAREIVKDYGKEDDRSNFESLEKEIREAIGSRDIDLLRQKIKNMETLR
jgi:molecular chaperone DnaK (HSP70)